MPMGNQAESPLSQSNSAQTSKTATSAARISTLSQAVMQNFSQNNEEISVIKVFVVLVIMVALGVGVGYSASLFSVRSGTSIISKALNQNAPVKGKVYGNGDPSVFKDTAEGVMQNGGIDGEGQYHLVRPGGDSQNVYLTSSTVDLSQFIGQKVKVWGETQKAQKAGWLMDVGKVEAE